MEKFVNYLLAAGLLAAIVALILVLRKNREPVTEPGADCPWYDRLFSWAKRHTPLVGLVVSLLGLLFVYRYLDPITYWVNNAHPVLPGQEMLDGDQIIAEHQAGGKKQFGAILTTFLGGTFFFSTLLFGVWSLLHYIFPAVPTWAKKNFSAGFRDYRDADFDPLLALPTTWKYGVKLFVLFGLLDLWAFCLFVAAEVQ